MNNDTSAKTRFRRQYTKSSLPRLRWTSELHHQFLGAVHNLGGKYKATPKQIMEMMGVKGLKISHIKSHLQTYRSMKEPTNFNGFISIGNCTTWLPLREEVKGASMSCKWRRKNISQHKYDCYNNRYLQETQGSSTNATSNGDGEIQEGNTISIWGNLGNYYQMSECSTHSPINLDLTMSSN